MTSSFHLLLLSCGIICTNFTYKKKMPKQKGYLNIHIHIKRYNAVLFKKQNKLTNKTCSSLKDWFANKEENKLSSSNISFYSERHIFPLSPNIRSTENDASICKANEFPLFSYCSLAKLREKMLFHFWILYKK